VGLLLAAMALGGRRLGEGEDAAVRQQERVPESSSTCQRAARWNAPRRPRAKSPPAIRTEPEVTDYQSLRRRGVAVQFQRAGAPLLHAQRRERGGHSGEPRCRSTNARRRVTTSPSASARAWLDIAKKFGARVAVAEVPPGPPVLQTLVAEIYGPTDEPRATHWRRQTIEIFQTTKGVVDTDWYIEADQPKMRFVIDKEKAALHGISAETISQTLAIAVGGQSVDLLHVPREKEDVNIVLQLPLASRTSAEELLALRVRSGDANALPEPGSATGTPPLIPLRELVTIERTITDKSIYHKNLMPVTYVIGDVAGEVESPVMRDPSDEPSPRAT
jgi:multidrug efflux pump subunit AcrB